MNLDIHHIATRRAKLDHGSRPMDYLRDVVSTELLERIGDHYTQGRWLVVDFSDSILRQENSSHAFCSLLEGQKLPQLNGARFDGAIINLQIAWLPFDHTLTEVVERVKPEGEVYFSTLGPDTLFELRQAWHAVDAGVHVHPFIDLHHLGDAMTKLGFVKPILDATWQGVEFEDIDLLMADLRRGGFHNVDSERKKTITRKSVLTKLRDGHSHRTFGATFEIVYGFGRVPKAQGSVSVNFTE